MLLPEPYGAPPPDEPWLSRARAHVLDRLRPALGLALAVYDGPLELVDAHADALVARWGRERVEHLVVELGSAVENLALGMQADGLARASGHPDDPLAWSRVGLSRAEVQRYDPALTAGPVQLGFVAVRRELALVTGDADGLWRALWPEVVAAAARELDKRGGAAAFVLLPLHPWQQQRVLSSTFADLIIHKRMATLRLRAEARPLPGLGYVGVGERTLALAMDAAPRGVGLEGALAGPASVSVRLDPEAVGVERAALLGAALVDAPPAPALLPLG